ncbi:MAG: hypothetical protein R3B07_25985 [Polyangiaceae bacterium]
MSRYLILSGLTFLALLGSGGCGPARRSCTPEVDACMQRCGENSPESDRSNATPPQADTRGPCRTACEDRYCR